MRGAIFFDRDGTLNEEVGYAGRPAEFRVFPYSAEAVRRVNQSGRAAVVVTNQAGIGRGYFGEAEVAALHHLLRQRLAEGEARLDGIYHCPHAPGEGCECRKPAPGMLRQAARELDLDLQASWVIGDRGLDVALAHAVGARAVLVRSGRARDLLEAQAAGPDHVAGNALEAVEWILERT